MDYGSFPKIVLKSVKMVLLFFVNLDNIVQ
jgi:hypothetical protein